MTDKELLAQNRGWLVLCHGIILTNLPTTPEAKVATELKRRLETGEREKALVEKLRVMREKKGSRIEMDDAVHVFKSDWKELMLLLAAYEGKEDVK